MSLSADDLKILIVDDDENILASMRRNLREYVIAVETDPKKALETIKEHSYAILISDMQMPFINGIDFLEEAKSINPMMIRIMLTGHADLQVTMDAVNRANVFHFLTKPINLDHLKDVIRKGLDEYIQLHERQVSEKNYMHMAMHDHLTGLPNRLLCKDRLDRAILRCQRYNKVCAVLYIDLDKFKPINDTHGHKAGDQVLCHVAEQMSECLRDMDTVARIGGDEFLILLQDLSAVEDAVLVADKVLAAIEVPVKLRNIDCQVSASIGVAVYSEQYDNSEKLISVADKAMYVAKESKDQQIVIF